MPAAPAIKGVATHYGAQYNGQVLGCGTGYYTSENLKIVAVSPARYREWPCGTNLRVCGDHGCIDAIRHDACPGCGANVLDLSEAGITAVCGDQAHVCKVAIEPLMAVVELPAGPEPPGGGSSGLVYLAHFEPVQY